MFGIVGTKEDKVSLVICFCFQDVCSYDGKPSLERCPDLSTIFFSETEALNNFVIDVALKLWLLMEVPSKLALVNTDF